MAVIALLLWIGLTLAVIIMHGLEPCLVGGLAALVAALIVTDRRQT